MENDSHGKIADDERIKPMATHLNNIAVGLAIGGDWRGLLRPDANVRCLENAML